MLREHQWLSVALMLALVIPVVATLSAAPVLADDIFSENFDSFSDGTLVTSMPGWILVHGGAGDALQCVGSAHTVSPPRALHLQGTGSWTARAYHALTLPMQLTYEAKIYMENVSDPFDCGGIHLYSLDDKCRGWVTFWPDGYIYAFQKQDGSDRVRLMSWVPGTWYLIRVNMDLAARRFDVYVNDSLMASGLEIETGTPTGIAVLSGSSPVTAWFDDLKVYTGPGVTTDNATSIMATTAILHGTLTSNSVAAATVVVYSGTTDGVTTPGNWTRSDNLTNVPAGPFSLGVTGLTPGTTYFYRCYAENPAGGAWAPSSASFTTQADLGLWRNYWEGPGKDWFWFSSGRP